MNCSKSYVLYLLRLFCYLLGQCPESTPMPHQGFGAYKKVELN